MSLSRLNYRVPACEVHPETLEGEQSPLCACNAVSQDGTRRGNTSTVTLGKFRHAGGTAGPCTVHQPSWGPPYLDGIVYINRDKLN